MFISPMAIHMEINIRVLTATAVWQIKWQSCLCMIPDLFSMGSGRNETGFSLLQCEVHVTKVTQLVNARPWIHIYFLHDFLYSEITHLLLTKKRIKSFQDIVLPLRILEVDRLSSLEYRLDNCIVNNTLTPLTWHSRFHDTIHFIL